MYPIKRNAQWTTNWSNLNFFCNLVDQHPRMRGCGSARVWKENKIRRSLNFNNWRAVLFFNLYEMPYKPRTDPNHVGVAGSNATSRQRHSSLLDSINQSSGSTPSHSRVWMSQINPIYLRRVNCLASEPGMNPFEVCGRCLWM